MAPSPGALAEAILERRRRVPAGRAVLVAVTGIDGSGKGHVTAGLEAALRARGARVAAILADRWLNLPQVRFGREKKAEHFYLHAIRFGDLFDKLVLPLRDRGSLRLAADLAEETAVAYHRHVYEFRDIEVVVLEGIYLLKRAFQGHYDLSFWIDCSSETALERALARRQEGLPSAETVDAYRTIYFPAQEIHIARDDPMGAATAIVPNDRRLGSWFPAAG